MIVFIFFVFLGDVDVICIVVFVDFDCYYGDVGVG